MAIVEEVGRGASGRRRLSLKNPATMEELGVIEVSTADDVNAAAEAARAAQPAWARVSLKDRAALVQKAVKVIVRRSEEIAAMSMSETGRTAQETLAMEVLAACDALTWAAKRAPRVLRDRRRWMHLLGPMKSLHLLHRPLGVVGVITPWNGPFILSVNPVAQALLAGNAVLLKPSEVTPNTGAMVGSIFEEAGLPPGVLQVLPGDGETGAALVDADVDKISFTGSVRTGRKIGEACGRRLIPCTLELGGKDPAIVCADANLDRAAAGTVFGACMNAGQVCMAVERIYVVEDIYDEFVDKVVEYCSSITPGGDADMGPIIWPPQLEVIESHLADALEKGATVALGGGRVKDTDGLYFEPTVVTGVTHDMALMKEETFGPVVAVMKVSDEEEALRLANDSDYGLSSSVWTGDKRKGLALARQIESGSACVNDSEIVYGVTEAPFGGLKQSGVGSVNSESGLLGYSHLMPVVIDRFNNDREQMWYPFDAKGADGMRKAINFLWNTPIGRWMS